MSRERFVLVAVAAHRSGDDVFLMTKHGWYRLKDVPIIITGTANQKTDSPQRSSSVASAVSTADPTSERN